MYIYKIKEYKVIDKDVIELIVDLGFKLVHKFSVRLTNLDTEELNTEVGRRALKYLYGLLFNTDYLTCKVFKVDQQDWVCQIRTSQLNIYTRLVNKEETFTLEELKLIEDALSEYSNVQDFG